MGSWSVYCGISRIAITAGDECVLLPLKEAKNTDYIPYTPATLPIFGEYDDYGGIENITKDGNTALIEEHFGISIEEFTTFLVDGKHTYDREEATEVANKMLHEDEARDWNFMWIDRKVYDFVSTYLDSSTKGTCHFGNPRFMEALGFEYVGEDKENKSYDPKRFYHKWKHGKKFFLSDGWVILSGTTKKSGYIHYIDNPGLYSKDSSLSSYITIPDDMLWIKEKADWQLWRFLEDSEKFGNLWILDESRYGYDGLFELMARLHPESTTPKEYKTLLSKYKRDYDQFGDRVADLITVRHNLHPMSGYFEPYIKYLTPQCGEFNHHQTLLEKFTQINNDKCFDEDE